MDSETWHLNIRVEGRVGHITLDRTKALNALSHNMVLSMSAALREWHADNRISMVLLDALGDRAFSAGGDITELYKLGVAGDFESTREYWRDEYALDALIANFSKPIVVIMDGLTMGGGVGIASHARHRIVTQRSLVSMPECLLGLVPDAGVMSIMATAPQNLGEYLSLTGFRLDAADAIYCGFADDYVPVEAIDDLKLALIEQADPEVISRFSQPLEAGSLSRREDEISSIFGRASVPEIFNALGERNDPWARKTIASLQACAPSSLACSLLAVRAARATPGVENALRSDFRFVSRCMEHGEFLEGIRAALIDKDQAPKWKYPRHEDMPAGFPEVMFGPAEGGDLKLPEIKTRKVGQ